MQEGGSPKCLHTVHREEVMEAIVNNSVRQLKEQMTGLTKLESIKKEDLRARQGYMETLSVEDARLEFRWRTGMLDDRANMGRRYSGKTCPHCEDGREDGAIESSRHWLTCTAYSELRRGLDPEDDIQHRVVFLRRVQMHRITLEKDLI